MKIFDVQKSLFVFHGASQRNAKSGTRSAIMPFDFNGLHKGIGAVKGRGS
jgi:hypothetical protein